MVRDHLLASAAQHTGEVAGTAHASAPRRVLRRADAARYLGVSIRTLERFATHGGGPRFVRLSSSMLGYTLEDLDAWLKARTFSSTSEEGRALGGRVA